MEEYVSFHSGSREVRVERVPGFVYPTLFVEKIYNAVAEFRGQSEREPEDCGLIYNSLLPLVSDELRFLILITGLQSSLAWVLGENRRWLGNIIEKCLTMEVSGLPSDVGWEDVVTMLKHGNFHVPVLTSWSSAPNLVVPALIECLPQNLENHERTKRILKRVEDYRIGPDNIRRKRILVHSHQFDWDVS